MCRVKGEFATFPQHAVGWSLTSAKTSGPVWAFMTTLEHDDSQVAPTCEPLVAQPTACMSVSGDEVDRQLVKGLFTPRGVWTMIEGHGHPVYRSSKQSGHVPKDLRRFRQR